jgi:hypothetical protein
MFARLSTVHQENVIYYGTLQTTTEHYVVLCSKIQPTDVALYALLVSTTVAAHTVNEVSLALRQDLTMLTS